MRSPSGAPPEPNRSPASRIAPSASRNQASPSHRLRKPGPATSTLASRSARRPCSSSPRRSATSRGGALSTGASSIAALVEESPKPARLGRSRVGEAEPCPLPSAAAAASTVERSSSSGVTSQMVRLVGEDLLRAEQLLEQDDLGELVGQRERPEREPVVARHLQAAGAPDDEAQVAPRHPALLQPAGEALGGEDVAAQGQQRDVGALGDAPGDGLVLAALDQLERRMPREQPGIVLD